MARQERELTQHSDAEPRASRGRDRLEAGREEETISLNRFWKSEDPSGGTVDEVAPLGAQRL